MVFLLISGDEVFDYNEAMDRELYVSTCCSLIDAINCLLSTCVKRDHGIRFVRIQTDSAGGHGGGRGSGMEKSLSRINKYAKRYSKVPICVMY